MSRPDQEDRVLLTQARQKARALLEDLLRKQEELDRDPPKLPPEKLAAGRQAFQNAIASARRMLQAIEDALRPCPAPDGG